MTPDFTARLLEAVGARVDRVSVSRYSQNTFYATVTVKGGGAWHEVDARPSDALNLAARVGAPIFVEAHVMDEWSAPSRVEVGRRLSQMRPDREQPAENTRDVGPPGALAPPHRYGRLTSMATGDGRDLAGGEAPQARTSPREAGVLAGSRAAESVIVIASGKGGVGKSTVSLNLALALAETDSKVGLLDADIYGPDIPVMLNLTRTKQRKRWPMWRNPDVHPLRFDPVERFGLKVMSVGFLLGEDQALSLPASSVHFVLDQLIGHVHWSELDYLVVDLPPGTADVQQRVVELLAPSGALMVVSPQDLAHLDAKKVLDMLRDAAVPVLGGVENMGPLICPRCSGEVELFPAVAESRSIWSAGIEPLAQFPFDPALARASERGKPLMLAEPDGDHAKRFRQLADRVAAALRG